MNNISVYIIYITIFQDIYRILQWFGLEGILNII